MGDPSDYWWLKPRESRTAENFRTGMALQQMHQEQRRAAVAERISQENQRLAAQKSVLEMKQYFDGKELQNKILAGNTALASTVKGITNWASVDSLRAIYDVGLKHPELMERPEFKGAVELHRNAVNAENAIRKIDEAGDVRLEVEKLKLASRMKEFEGKREDVKRRLDIMEQQGFQRDELGRMRLELDRLRADDNAYYNEEKIKSFRDRTDYLEAQLRLSKERFENEKKKLSTADRIQYESAVESLNNKFNAGAFNPPGTEIIPTAEQKKAAADAYDRELEKINKKFFGNDSGFREMPVAPTAEPQAKPIGQPAGKKKLSDAEVSSFRAQAEEAIRKGAPREAVMQRLKELIGE